MKHTMIVECRCPVCGTCTTFRKVVQSDGNKITKSITRLMCLFCYAKHLESKMVDLTWLTE